MQLKDATNNLILKLSNVKHRSLGNRPHPGLFLHGFLQELNGTPSTLPQPGGLGLTEIRHLSFHIETTVVLLFFETRSEIHRFPQSGQRCLVMTWMAFLSSFDNLILFLATPFVDPRVDEGPMTWPNRRARSSFLTGSQNMMRVFRILSKRRQSSHYITSPHF